MRWYKVPAIIFNKSRDWECFFTVVDQKQRQKYKIYGSESVAQQAIFQKIVQNNEFKMDIITIVIHNKSIMFNNTYTSSFMVINYNMFK